MEIGRLAALRRYPVKSLRGDAFDCIQVDADGIAGDRARALFARSGARAGKTYRGKEHDRLHLLGDADAASASASRRGVDVELRAGQHFFDDAPISVLVDSWLEDLSSYVGYAVEWERFRPNFFVRAEVSPAPLEQTLVDARLQLGTVLLRVRSPIERCVTVTYHPSGAASDPRILSYLGQQRNAMMGIYCDVLSPGVACLGDALMYC